MLFRSSLPAFIFSFGNIRSSDSLSGTFTTSHPRLTHLLTVPSSLTAPGRNLAVIVEAAAVNHRQKKMGYNAAKELYRRVQENLMRGDDDDE